VGTGVGVGRKVALISSIIITNTKFTCSPLFIVGVGGFLNNSVARLKYFFVLLFLSAHPESRPAIIVNIW
jgi:hypothetical protein